MITSSAKNPHIVPLKAQDDEFTVAIEIGDPPLTLYLNEGAALPPVPMSFA